MNQALIGLASCGKVLPIIVVNTEARQSTKTKLRFLLKYALYTCVCV